MVDERAILEVWSSVCVCMFGRVAPREEELTIFLSSKRVHWDKEYNLCHQGGHSLAYINCAETIHRCFCPSMYVLYWLSNFDAVSGGRAVSMNI